MHMHFETLPLALATVMAVGAAGCGDDVAAYSEPISLKLSGIKKGDIKSNAFDRDKSVNSETNNPYQAFLRNARSELGGEDPSAIEVEKLILTVASDSKFIGTDGFATVASTLEVYLADSSATVVLGTLTMVPVGTTVEMPVDATADNLRPLLLSMLNSNFKVGLRGNAAVQLPAEDFELKTNVQITFRALE